MGAGGVSRFVMSRRLLLSLVLLSGLLLPLAPPLAADANAQFWRNIGFGARVGAIVPTDDDVRGATFWGGSGGMVPDEGWGPAFSLGWFDADLREDGSGSRTLGTIDVRPVMGGIAYTWLTGRLAITASLTAGVSFNGGSIDNALQGSGIDAALVDIEIGNSFAVRPELEAEWFLARKFALTGGIGYLHTRPDITVRLPDRELSGRWDASTFSLFAGVTVYPFR